MTTWNTPSDKGLKSRTEDSKNNSENIWGDFTEDFHQELHDRKSIGQSLAVHGT